MVTHCPTVFKDEAYYLWDNDNVSQDAQMAFAPRLLGTPPKGPMRRPAGRAWTGLIVAGAGLAASLAAGPAAGWTAPAHAAGPVAGNGTLGACIAAVANGKGKGTEIICDYRAFLTDAERADMRRLSRGLLQDAACRVTVRIARKPVEEALTRPDHVFEAPPQPVRCEITTKDGGFPINATFAPRVVFKGGLAVEATPGLANVAGINRYLAWPVVQYVNRSPGVRRDMMQIINAIKPHLAGH